MTRVYIDACVQVHMRGGELLRYTGVQHSKTLVTPLESRVVIKASREMMMHNKASNIVSNAAEQMKLEVVLANSAVVVHLDTSDKLLISLIQIQRCDTSDDPSPVVAIDVEFDANRNTGGDRRPILRLIGLC